MSPSCMLTGNPVCSALRHVQYNCTRIFNPAVQAEEVMGAAIKVPAIQYHVGKRYTY